MSEISVCNLTWEDLLPNFLLRVSLVTYPLKLYAARPVKKKGSTLSENYFYDCMCAVFQSAWAPPRPHCLLCS